MKKLQKALLGVFAASALVFSSCGDDGEDPVGPSLNFVGASSADATVSEGDTVTFSILAQQGDKDMDKITFRENGNDLNTSKFLVNGEMAESNGFYELKGGDQNQVTLEISLIAGSESTTIAIAAVDKDDLTAGLEVTITVEGPSTALTETTGYKVYNASGANQGSFDLSAKATVAGSSSDGNFQDLGLTSDLSAWEQKIEPKNGASMVAITSTQYAALDEETIATVYAGETEISSSDELAVGDAFIFSVNGTYYAIKITAIDVTASDNNDSITFSLLTSSTAETAEGKVIAEEMVKEAA